MSGINWRRKWQPTPVFLPGKSYGQRSLEDYSPWGHKELDLTEGLSMLAHTHTHIHTHTSTCSLISNFKDVIFFSNSIIDLFLSAYSFHFSPRNNVCSAYCSIVISLYLTPDSTQNCGLCLDFGVTYRSLSIGEV